MAIVAVLSAVAFTSLLTALALAATPNPFTDRRRPAASGRDGNADPGAAPGMP